MKYNVQHTYMTMGENDQPIVDHINYYHVDLLDLAETIRRELENPGEGSGTTVSLTVGLANEEWVRM